MSIVPPRGPTVLVLVSLVALNAGAQSTHVTYTEPAWSPDGSRLAYAFGEWPNFDVYTSAADGSDVVRLTFSDSTEYYPAWSPDGTRIAFASNRDGPFEVYVMDSNGDNVRRVTRRGGDRPVWSPDGKHIVFQTDRDGNRELYVMDPDGTHQVNLTHNPGNDEHGEWSPDGSRIAFASSRGGRHDEAYVMNADGSGVRRLTFAASPASVSSREAVYARRPYWSPDGTRIAFGSNRDGNDEIYVMGSDGTGITRLTNTPEKEYYSAWSPDGASIAFSSNRRGGFELYVMHADGSGITRVAPSTRPEARHAVPGEDPFYQEISWAPNGTQLLLSGLKDRAYRIYRTNADGTGLTVLVDGPGNNYWTAWSPDGAHVAWASDRDGQWELYVMAAEGGPHVRLTNDPGRDTTPSWSPDGERLVFVSDRDGARSLYVIDADGSNLTRIGGGPGELYNPVWSPDGNRIVYYGSDDGGQSDWVYLIGLDGSERRRIAPGYWPSWSPDGRRIVYVHGERGLPTGVYSMKDDGTETVHLADDAVLAEWSPDGEKLALLRSVGDQWPRASELYIGGADGSNLRWVPLVGGSGEEE